MKKLCLLASLFVMIAGYSKAVTVNPTSNVYGDSSATASTLMYRDSTNSVETGANGTTQRLAAVGGTAASQSSLSGITVLAPFQEGTGDNVGFGVTASTIIPVNSSYINVIADGAGSAVTLTSTPNISTTTTIGGSTLIPDGTFIIIASTATAADAVVLQSSGTLANSQLQLGLGTRSIWSAHNIGLIFDANSKCWKELWYH